MHFNLLAFWTALQVSASFAATCTLTGPATLSTSASSWNCGHIPNSSDTAVINGGTLNVDMAWTFGPSPAPAAAVLTINNGAIVNVLASGSVQIRGDAVHTCYYNCQDAAVTMQPGAVWIWDSGVSGVAYSFHAGGDTEYRGFWADCSAGAACTITSTGTANGFFSTGGYATGRNYIFKNVHLSLLGSATRDAITGISPFALSGNTLDQCGRVNFSGMAVASGKDAIYDGNVHTNSLGTSNLEIATYTSDPKTTETRELIGNVFDKQIQKVGGEILGFLVTDNYFAQGIAPGSNTWGAATYRRNFLRLDSTMNAAVDTSIVGTAIDHYILVDFPVINAHDMAALAPSTAQRIIFDHADDDTGDSGDNTFSSPNASAYNWQNLIDLPDAAGDSNGILISKSGNRASTDILTHSTWYGNTNGEAMARYSESGSNTAGQLQVLSNIAWGLAGTFHIVKDVAAFTGGTVAQDVCTPASCDYNWGFGVTSTNVGCVGCTNEGRGYVGKFSVTPGAHDHSGDPAFGDYKRMVALWDTKYLGHTAPAWSSGASYSVGDTVSHAVAGTYWGLTINYRRVTANTNGTVCSGNPEPGILNGSYRNCWEFASLHDIRQGVVNQTKIYDGATQCGYGCTYPEAVVHWVERGYTPQNPLLRAAGHDGTDIGAVPMDPVVYVPPTVF